jgi:hypothetical protein
MFGIIMILAYVIYIRRTNVMNYDVIVIGASAAGATAALTARKH